MQSNKLKQALVIDGYRTWTITNILALTLILKSINQSFQSVFLDLNFLTRRDAIQIKEDNSPKAKGSMPTNKIS